MNKYYAIFLFSLYFLILNISFIMSLDLSDSVQLNIEGLKSSYLPNETVSLKISTLNLVNNILVSPENGFNIQAYVNPLVPAPGQPVEYGDNARYSNGYWYVDSAGPFSMGTHILEIILYCSNDNSVCSNTYGTSDNRQVLNIEVKDVNTCSDSDNGLVPAVKGTVEYKRNSYTDACFFNDTSMSQVTYSCNGPGCTIIEQYCDSTSNVNQEVYGCTNLCMDGVCSQTDEGPRTSCDSGCLLTDKCFGMGVRKNGAYCSEKNIFANQLDTNKICQNHFECKSNFCVSEKCTDSGLIDKILAYFKKMFKHR